MNIEPVIISPKQVISQSTKVREGEIKLGEKIQYPKESIESLKDLDKIIQKTKANFILLGIPEDIGIRANLGKGGAVDAFDTFLSYFVNTQLNDYIQIDSVFVLGSVNVDNLMAQSQKTKDIQELRALCSQVDDLVYPIIELIIKNKKTPIVIGGGHNNSYPIIKGAKLALKKKIDVLNIDPHFDIRALEGRHSGNGFSYAIQDKFIGKYLVWGFHKPYNNQFILDSLNSSKQIGGVPFESILYEGDEIIDFLPLLGDSIGMELDMDSIKDMPSSSKTPFGFSEENIIVSMHDIKENKTIIYYHISEAIASENPNKVGKFLTYLIREIIAD